MSKYVLTIDQGTTSTKAFLLDRWGKLISSGGVPVTQHYPEPGFVEHDAGEIYLTVLRAAAKLLLEHPEAIGEIDCLALTNQRETTIAWNKETCVPVYNAIVWQCRRTAEICRRPEYTSAISTISSITGLKLDPYFSATKMRWLLENVPGLEKSVAAGEVLFGTVDSYLVYCLTAGSSFMTDYSNASRTLLFDITALDYSPSLLSLFDIPRHALPSPKPSCFDYGIVDLSVETLVRLGLSYEEASVLIKLNGVHITGVAGDQAAALFGQNCFSVGDAKTTYGTGCFTLMNVGTSPVFSSSGLLTSAAWSINGETTYALEGSVFQGGSVISWLKDEMCLINEPSDCDSLCMSLSSNAGVYLVPAFTGLGAPYWNPDARGVLVGLTRGSGRAHIVRAGVESIAYQVTELVELMMADTGITSSHMKVDGGVCGSQFLMQLQSDLLGATITRAKSDEMTALGVGLLAGLTTSFYSSVSDVAALYSPGAVYKPSMSSSSAKRLMSEYKSAVKAAVMLGGES